jgi:hypothetical protein
MNVRDSFSRVREKEALASRGSDEGVTQISDPVHRIARVKPLTRALLSP